jgi:hypothetical protein
MKIQKIFLGLIAVVLFAANANAGRWLTRDPLEFMERDAPPQANLYTFVDNNPINEIDPLGLEPYTELMSAMAEGNAEQIQLILDTEGDLISPSLRSRAFDKLKSIAAQKTRQEAERLAAEQEAKRLAQEAANRLKQKAGDIISKECRGGINREFPDQLRGDTLEQIKLLHGS